MKYYKIISLFVIAAAIAGCNGLGKMSKNAGTVKYEVTPNPLELHGDSVAITVKGTYPPKYFAKKVSLTVTPSLKSASGEKSFKPITIVGEKVEGNGTKINMKAGGSFTYTDKMAYTSDLRAADVMVNIKGMKGKTEKALPSTKIADATITTPLLVKADEKVLIGKDNFQRIVPVTYDGKMYYPINVGTLNANFKHSQSGISNKAQSAAVDSILKACAAPDMALKSVNVTGNASPDGKVDLNTRLAENRSKSSDKYLAERMKKMKMKADSVAMTTSIVAEDWPGFQKLMQESDMEMKDVILRIVSSNSDPEAREMEIKKMGKAYKEIADGIMPKLRKADYTFNAEKTGRSDEEISRLAKSNPDSLSVEEILYAATLTQDNTEKLAIYTAGERIYPQDWRAANNAGMIKFQMKDVDGAMAEFTKADQLNANNAIVMNNLGASYRMKGDRTKAAEMYAAASSAGPEVGENMAILDILDGNYAEAVSHCGSAATFNCSLAKLLSGDKDGAMTTIEASPDKDSAVGLYLKAVISARKGDGAGVTSNLTASIAKDPAMKDMAKDDREFIKWYGDAGFKGITQ
jgi:tetratricopeptide (TPR) repeat protein